MRAFISYFGAYLRTVSRPALIITIVFFAPLIAANYRFGLEHRIQALPWYTALGIFFGFFLVLLALVWGLQKRTTGPSAEGQSLAVFWRGAKFP